jgi:hypothetical protein
MPPAVEDVDIVELLRRVPDFRRRMVEVKRKLPGVRFYPYDTMGNIDALHATLTGERRHLLRLTEGRPVADIGAADGDLAFFLETLGVDMQIIDNPPTNHNGLAGARALKQTLGSSVEIHEVDLDSQFRLPRNDYGLVSFLGILYHLKNPYYALEELAKSSRHLLLSTRVAQYARPLHLRLPGARLLGSLVEKLPIARPMVRMAELPVAYLVDERECNNDPTNFWIFSVEGLKRILTRSGWEILDFKTFGNRFRSDPASKEGDERAFCLARSRTFKRQF